MRVFVRCCGCRELVACYELSRYYHHGKEADSYLRSLGHEEAESGRRLLEDFKRVKREVLEAYPEVLRALKEQGKDD